MCHNMNLILNKLSVYGHYTDDERDCVKHERFDQPGRSVVHVHRFCDADFAGHYRGWVRGLGDRPSPGLLQQHPQRLRFISALMAILISVSPFNFVNAATLDFGTGHTPGGASVLIGNAGLCSSGLQGHWRFDFTPERNIKINSATFYVASTSTGGLPDLYVVTSTLQMNLGSGFENVDFSTSSIGGPDVNLQSMNNDAQTATFIYNGLDVPSGSTVRFLFSDETSSLLSITGNYIQGSLAFSSSTENITNFAVVCPGHTTPLNGLIPFFSINVALGDLPLPESTYDGFFSTNTPSFLWGSTSPTLYGDGIVGQHFNSFVGSATNTFPLCVAYSWLSLIDTAEKLTSGGQNSQSIIFAGGIIPTTTLSLSQAPSVFASIGLVNILNLIIPFTEALAWLSLGYFIFKDLFMGSNDQQNYD